ncbi:hypothetical protein [Roseovarius phycicola]|uniref:Uncharacterized protein n=1 Tax=Roseovarius phycicola TaxID=3080976 RepID=A0ABZ2HK53_9RHOB
MATQVAKAEIIPKERPALDRALKRLARPERLIYGAPIMAGTGKHDLLCAVLREIDETILPREIIIECQVFGTMRLSVSNRRLAAIRFDHDVDQTPMVEAEDSQDMAKQFAQILTQAFDTSKEARIVRPRRLPPGTSFNMSCSCQSLADAAGIEDFRLAPAVEEARFDDVIQGVARALVKTNGDLASYATTGSQGEVDLLKEFHSNFQNGHSARGHARRLNLDEPQCLMVPLANARTIVLTVGEEGHMLALVPNEDTPRLTQAWHAERNALTTS